MSDRVTRPARQDGRARARRLPGRLRGGGHLPHLGDEPALPFRLHRLDRLAADHDRPPVHRRRLPLLRAGGERVPAVHACSRRPAASSAGSRATRGRGRAVRQEDRLRARRPLRRIAQRDPQGDRRDAGERPAEAARRAAPDHGPARDQRAGRDRDAAARRRRSATRRSPTSRSAWSRAGPRSRSPGRSRSTLESTAPSSCRSRRSSRRARTARCRTPSRPTPRSRTATRS